MFESLCGPAPRQRLGGVRISVPKALALEMELSQVLAAPFSIGPEWSIGSFGKHPCTHPSGSLFLESE